MELESFSVQGLERTGLFFLRFWDVGFKKQQINAANLRMTFLYEQMYENPTWTGILIHNVPRNIQFVIQLSDSFKAINYLRDTYASA